MQLSLENCLWEALPDDNLAGNQKGSCVDANALDAKCVSHSLDVLNQSLGMRLHYLTFQSYFDSDYPTNAVSRNVAAAGELAEESLCTDTTPIVHSSFPPLPETVSLWQLRDNINSKLDHFQEAIQLAKNCDSVEESFDSKVKRFLEDYYDLMDPQGIAERQAEGQMIEQEWDDCETNYLGHLFVYNRARFHEETASAPADLQVTFRRIAEHCPPDCILMITTRSEYEDWYFSYADVAGQWQYKVPDDSQRGDDGMLLPLLQAMRRFIRREP